MVEHLLAKEGVEGSNPFFRSNAFYDPRLLALARAWSATHQKPGYAPNAVPLIPRKL